MFRRANLRSHLGALLELRPDPGVSLPGRLAAVSFLAVALALGLMAFAGTFGHMGPADWWRRSLLPVIGICLCIVHTLNAVMWLAGRWLPAPLVARLADVRDIRAGMAVSALVLSGIVMGMALGFTIVPILAGFSMRDMFMSVPVALVKFGIFLLVVMAINWAWWRARLHRQALRGEATEAQLRLLQGQIEPHLLFNTLANIQSLMDYDPPRAKRMLETFSGYLRSGLSQLRQSDSTLGAELDMAQHYLALFQIRMEERLAFRIEASDDARAAIMPTLLLQPLVENAIHHGLEPKVDGGNVLISAQVRDGRLHVRVSDDGMGLDGQGRLLRPGAGMALANLRQRLRTRYGANASLTLQAGSSGADAVLDLPYLRAP